VAGLKFNAPLDWPEWIPVTPRAHQKNDRNFAPPMPLEESISFLEHEVQATGLTATLSLDIDQPAIDRLAKRVGGRNGAALYIRYADSHYVIACDIWQAVEHNIYAIHLTLRQMQNIQKWGVAPLAVLLEGFKTGQKVKQAKTEPSASEGQLQILGWMNKLGLGPSATLDDAQAVYHRRAKQVAHDSDALSKLNITMEEARAYFARK
jgi:hypothetical protein